jgi:signal transduction histidine kinase
VAHGELRVLDEGGEPLAVDARVVAIDLEESRVLLLALRDLTARTQMEHQLLVRERLSSLGLLTAGVAHEINNPLEGIGNYLSLLGRDGLVPEQRARYLEAVGHGFGRFRDIARDLLRFARPSRAGGRRADLVGVVERALSLVRLSRALSDVEVTAVGLAQPLFVEGDAGQLEQVVVNLLINAARANSTGGGGAVTLRARTLQDARGTRVVELDVEDDGPGIPERDLERIFDPFFSSTGGTGLGLAVTYGIVSAHAGSIRVRNVEGRGACFTIALPLSHEPASPETDASEPPPSDRPGASRTS